MRSYPKLPLARPFVRALRESDRSLFNLSAHVGFASNTQLSTMMNAPSVRATPLVRGRLEALAQLVGYDGPVFKERVSRG